MWGVTSHTTHRPLPARAHPHSVPTPGWWLGGVCSVAGAGVEGVCMGTGRTAGPTPARRKGVRSPGQGAGGWAAPQRRGTSWETPTGPLALPWAPVTGPPAVATPTPHSLCLHVAPLSPAPWALARTRSGSPILEPCQGLEPHTLFTLQATSLASSMAPAVPLALWPLAHRSASPMPPPPGSPPACTGSLPMPSFSSHPTPHPPSAPLQAPAL